MKKDRIELADQTGRILIQTVMIIKEKMTEKDVEELVNAYTAVFKSAVIADIMQELKRSLLAGEPLEKFKKSIQDLSASL